MEGADRADLGREGTHAMQTAYQTTKNLQIFPKKDKIVKNPSFFTEYRLKPPYGGGFLLQYSHEQHENQHLKQVDPRSSPGE